MRKLGRLLLLAGLTALAGLILVACGGGSSSSGGSSGGTATVLMGTAPDYLDPQEEYTTQGAEADWISYTPLVTYKHENAPGGNELIPGLATALPQISSDRQDLHAHAAQGPRVLERPARQGERLRVHGRAHDQGQLGRQALRHRLRRGRRPPSTRARRTTISGITTDDATGKITIQLDEALRRVRERAGVPRAGPGPERHADDTTCRPTRRPGVGPYMITDIVPNQSFSVVKNPKFAALNIPDIPTGHLDTINVKIASNTQTEAQQVLNNQADVFDAGDTLPPSLRAADPVAGERSLRAQ